MVNNRGVHPDGQVSPCLMAWLLLLTQSEKMTIPIVHPMPTKTPNLKMADHCYTLVFNLLPHPGTDTLWFAEVMKYSRIYLMNFTIFIFTPHRKIHVFGPISLVSTVIPHPLQTPALQPLISIDPSIHLPSPNLITHALLRYRVTPHPHPQGRLSVSSVSPSQRRPSSGTPLRTFPRCDLDLAPII
jgi:hypothetical protein